jgi:Holliday junction DNA helicase RuvA
MIGRLRGKLLEKHPPVLIVDVGGVGYEVQASMNTFYALPEVGEEIVLLTQMIVREDAQLLYGFYQMQERQLFRALIKVNGIGPRIALAILSHMTPEVFVACIHRGDTQSLVRIPGVGKKTAERLLIEMRDRLQKWGSEEGSREKPAATIAVSADMITQDAMSALVSLGYKPPDAARAVAKLSSKSLTLEEMIRAALQEM